MSAAAACARCLLPTTVPGVGIDATGLCATCRSTPDEAALAHERQALRTIMAAAVDERRGARPYEVVVAYSGGKDSSFALRHLVEGLGLRCLAVTIDNGFLSQDTFANCKAVCGALGVDHMIFAPSARFTERMYRLSAEGDGLHPPSAIRRASAICSSCITLINTHVLQKAFELGAPMVAGGYLGGQVPRDGALMTVRSSVQARARTSVVKRFVDVLGEEARPYFELRADPGADVSIMVMNPMLGIDLGEEEIIAALLPMGWKRPTDTGITSTNCRLNDLGVYLHTRRHGFHPYALEVADQLRHGVLSRADAERKLHTLPGREDVRWLADRLKLAADAI
jgi:hypothetical protein